MKITVFALLSCVIGCGSSGSSGGTSTTNGSPLDGTWMYVDGTVASGVTFDNGTFVVQQLQETCADCTSADDEIEKGTYTVSGNVITLTVQEWSCQLQSGQSPTYTETFSFETNGDLTLSDTSGIVTFQPDTSTGGSVAITIGCFDSSGNFTPEPLTSVN